jgi:PAS domain S-box-containing protein
MLIPILFLQTGIYYSRFERIRELMLKINLEEARAMAEALESFTNNVFSQELFIGTALTTLPQPMTKEQIEQILKTGKADFPAIRDLSWIDPRGIILASTNVNGAGRDIGFYPYVGEITAGHEKVLGNLFPAKDTGQPTLAIFRATRDRAGKLLGVVLATIDPNRLDEAFSIERSRGGTISIVDREGMLVYGHPERQWTWEERKWLNKHPQIKETLEGKEFTTVYDEPDGNRRIMALVPVRSVGWALAADLPEDEALAPVISRLVYHLSLLLLALIAIFIVALVISNRIAVPVQILRKHALALGHGKERKLVRINGPAELQDLADALNTMAEKIHSREKSLLEVQNQLETRVKERTADMEKTIDFLKTETMERLMAEKALRNERQRLFSLLDILPAFVFLLAPDYSIRYANSKFRELFGVREGRFCYDVLQQQEQPCERCPAFRIFETRLQEHREWESPDHRVYEIYNSPFEDTDGSLLLMELGVDITERKRAEEVLKSNAQKREQSNRELAAAMEQLNSHQEELRRQNIRMLEAQSTVELERQRYQELFDFAPDGYLVTHENGIIRKANHAAAAMLRVEQESLLNLPLLGYIAEEDREVFRVQLNHLKKAVTTVKGWEVRLKPERGDPFPASITVTTVQPRLSEGRALRWLIRDISEQKRFHEALQESEKQLRFLSSRLLSAQEEERKRLARELHDSIGSSLSAIKFGLERGLKEMEAGAAKLESLQNLVSVTQNAIDEARRMMTELRPSILDDLGLVSTIGWFCRNYRTIYTSIYVEDEIELEESDVPESLKIVIFRIIQEAFHNIAKSSKAELVNLRLTKADHIIELSIEDNGTGFDFEAVLASSMCERGLGLTSMRERAELSGGTFEIQSILGEGTLIRAAWPLVRPLSSLSIPAPEIPSQVC